MTSPRVSFAKLKQAALNLTRQITVITGLSEIPDRKSHPLVYEWVGVNFRSEKFVSLTTFDEVIERTGLGGGTAIANRGLPMDIKALARLLPAAVEEARRHIVECRNEFEDAINAKLDEELKALEQLRARRFVQLELKLEQSTSRRPARPTERSGRAATSRKSSTTTWSGFRKPCPRKGRRGSR